MSRQPIVECFTNKLRQDKTELHLCRELFNSLAVASDPGTRAYCTVCKQFGLLEDDGHIRLSTEPPPRPPFVDRPRHAPRRTREPAEKRGNIFQHPDFRRGQSIKST